MSRSKKTRSLKSNHGGLKTGSKERTKLESKQRKASKKLANPRKVTRQRSVYQQHLDSNNLVEDQHGKKAKLQIESTDNTHSVAPQNNVAKPSKHTSRFEKPSLITTENQKNNTAPNVIDSQPSEADLWDQLEQPQENDIF